MPRLCVHCGHRRLYLHGVPSALWQLLYTRHFPTAGGLIRPDAGDTPDALAGSDGNVELKEIKESSLSPRPTRVPDTPHPAGRIARSPAPAPRRRRSKLKQTPSPQQVRPQSSPVLTGTPGLGSGASQSHRGVHWLTPDVQTCPTSQGGYR